MPRRISHLAYAGALAALLTGLVALVDGAAVRRSAFTPRPREVGATGPAPGTPSAKPHQDRPTPEISRTEREASIEHLDPPHESIDGLTLRRGLSTVRLAGLDGPARDAVCRRPSGEAWACGLQARAALHNVMARRPILCRVVAWPAPDAVQAECSVAGADIGGALVRQGWARPSGGQATVYAAELERARAERAGLWAGAWPAER